MTIEESDFRLIPESETVPKFDLELLYTVKPRGGEARTEFKPSGYGITLEYAIKKIAHFRINQRHKDEAIRLLDYFNEFKKELEDLKKMCQIIDMPINDPN